MRFNQSHLKRRQVPKQRRSNIKKRPLYSAPINVAGFLQFTLHSGASKRCGVANNLGEFSKILMLSGQAEILNVFSRLGGFLDSAIVNLYSKKETLDKLDTSDLEKIKNYFKELWSIKTVFSKQKCFSLLFYCYF